MNYLSIYSNNESEEFFNILLPWYAEIPQEAWDICGIEELDYYQELMWEIESECASMAEYFMQEQKDMEYCDCLPW